MNKIYVCLKQERPETDNFAIQKISGCGGKILVERICLALFPVIIFFKESFLMLPISVYREY